MSRPFGACFTLREDTPMPGKRISELTALSGAASANNDDLLIFDSGAGETKRISRSQLAEGMVPDLPLQYYLGVLNANPTQRLNGDALQIGDFYLDAVTKYTTVYNGSGWNSYASVIAAQAAAKAARDKAQEWATNPEDDPVETGQFSSLHWAAKAKDEKLAAQVARTGAETAETNAETAEAGAVAAQVAAELARAGAETAEANAESARDSAFVNAQVYADTAAGLAATSVGQQFQVVSGDEIIRYRHDAGPVATEVARYPAAGPVREALEFGTTRQRYLDGLRTANALRPKAAVVVLLGQSLNAPRGTILRAKGAPGAKMPFGGAAIGSWQFNAITEEFVAHWSETASAVDFEERTGQTPMVGIVNTITGGKFARTYMGSAAIAARKLETLMAGGPLANLWALVQRLCALARADGYDPEVMFYTAHGESNAYHATTEQDYYALGMEYYGRAQLYAAQAMRKPGYVAPVVFTYPAPGTVNGRTYAEVKEAIRRIAADLPGGIDMGGIYHWPMEGDQVHPTPAGSILRGEAIGRVLRAYAESGRKWAGLHIVDVTLSGTQFVATFSAPVQRDATLGVGQSLNAANAEDGFEWLDNGIQIAISSLTYEGWKVRGTLASTPTGTLSQQILRISSQLVMGSGAWPGSLSGSLVRSQEAGWPSIHDHTYTNYIWAAPQVFDSVRAA